jgi:parallel beta-helix repeat protein
MSSILLVRLLLNWHGSFHKGGNEAMKSSILATFFTPGVYIVAALLSVPPVARAANINVSCPGQSLQAAIDIAQPGDMIIVTGTCNENLLVRNEKQRFFILGGGSAVLNGPSSASPTLNVRGKGVFVQGFTITGGSRGVHVNRNSNSIITDNLIQSTGGDGVVVDELAFCVIKNNVIQNNPGNGIVVSENAVARIGFEFPEDTAAQPNTITNNGAAGILVSRSSSARIAGNTISNNTGDGIFVTRNAQADASSNVINANGGNAVNVSENGSVLLGEPSPANFFQQPNTTTSNNTGFGIRCDQGGAVRAVLSGPNPLFGTGGQSSIHISCPFSVS